MTSTDVPAGLMTPHVLVLGGAADARSLISAMQAEPGLNLRVTLSLAGRTSNPSPQQPGAICVTQRVGGFGGAEGLADFVRQQRVACIIDATHPFAARISANAVAAARMTGVPLLRLVRPGWQAGAGDDWRDVADMAAAVAAIGVAPRRVFLTIGRQNLAAFMAAPQHVYVARTIEAADADVQLAHVSWIAARGPFSLAGELALLRAHGIDIIVSKNSGGAATSAKLAAARQLGLPVIMIKRPEYSGGEETGSVADAVVWIRRMIGPHHGACPAAERGE